MVGGGAGILEGIVKEPIHETVEMEYYQKLVNLNASE